MSDPTQCDECQAILEEFRSASTEIGASPKLREELRTDCEALLKMMEGNEANIDEGIAKFQFRPQGLGAPEPPAYRFPRIGHAVRKLLDHHVRTGHNIMYILFRK